MSSPEGALNGHRWLRIAGTNRQAIIKLAENIDDLNRRGCAVEAMEAEHDAIETLLQSLSMAVLTGADRGEVIDILNASIDFCAAHFADEEEFMRKSGTAHADVHTAAHKTLLATMVAARRSASGEGLSLAVLDATDLLHAFHEHVRLYDHPEAESAPQRTA